jgi:hypothetical protein
MNTKQLKKRHIKPRIYWYWLDFGIMFKVYKNIGCATHQMTIDIQVAWFNLCILLIKNKDKIHE